MKDARKQKDWLSSMDLTLQSIERALNAVLEPKDKADLVGLHLSHLFDHPEKISDQQVRRCVFYTFYAHHLT